MDCISHSQLQQQPKLVALSTKAHKFVARKYYKRTRALTRELMEGSMSMYVDEGANKGQHIANGGQYIANGGQYIANGGQYIANGGQH